MAFLELQRVSKSFPTAGGSREILKNVALSVEEGQFVAIVGYSGSGKTTLISLIAGLLEPDQGRILLRGAPIQGPGPDRGIIFQTYSLLPWMSAFENIHLAVCAASPELNRKQQKARTEEYLKLVKLDHAAWKKPKELSGGMRQRVAVARGLAMNPAVLLMDEPFSALDALTRATLQDELSRIWERERKTVILITNDVDEAVLLADYIYPLTPGPGAHLGAGIAVNIPRPRVRRQLSLSPAYQQVRREIVDFLTHHREIGRSANGRASNGHAQPSLSPALQGAS